MRMGGFARHGRRDGRSAAVALVLVAYQRVERNFFNDCRVYRVDVAAVGAFFGEQFGSIRQEHDDYGCRHYCSVVDYHASDTTGERRALGEILQARATDNSRVEANLSVRAGHRT